eukprot:scaffold6667_cov111-Isochrysis_galbana.AAC.1
MTDPPTDDTEAREQDAPGTHDAKRQAPVHGHTGGLPSDKALSDTSYAVRIRACFPMLLACAPLGAAS